MLAVLVTAACVDRDPMQVQPRDDAYRLDPAFTDGQAMRPEVPGTVSREQYDSDAEATHEPPRVTVTMLRTGRERFDVWCAPCHGALGNGEGPVARKMMLREPPSLLAAPAAVHPTLEQNSADDRGAASAGWNALPRKPFEYFQIITHGYGLMPSYGAQIPARERWAIIAYLRALAYSQRAPLAAADEAARQQLYGEKEGP
ncbi:MAG: cytochrome c [Myxococcaceae bacterium]